MGISAASLKEQKENRPENAKAKQKIRLNNLFISPPPIAYFCHFYRLQIFLLNYFPAKPST
jgi:hypothetical protein